jgi:zinc transporter ZupT
MTAAVADWFAGLNPIAQAFLATLFTWGMTALGAAVVFLFRGGPPAARRGARVHRRGHGRCLVLVAARALDMRPILPYALAFAAGAMIFVVVEEVVPESQAGGHPDLATSGAILGFAVMMVLDVALG